MPTKGRRRLVDLRAGFDAIFECPQVGTRGVARQQRPIRRAPDAIAELGDARDLEPCAPRLVEPVVQLNPGAVFEYGVSMSLGRVDRRDHGSGDARREITEL